MVWNPEYKRQEKYYYKNKEKLCKKARIYHRTDRKQHPEKYRKKVIPIQWPPKSNAYIEMSKKFWKEHPNFYKWEENKEKKAIRQKRYWNQKRGAEGSHTLEEWEIKKKEFNYCCSICGNEEPFEDQYFKKLTEDHIIPISKNGTDYIDNIQPVCHRCNIIKGNKSYK